jgi:hypothetical protein
MTTLRECPFCSSPDPTSRSFRFERSLSVSAINCNCGAFIVLPDGEATPAWQLRKRTDKLLLQALPVLRVFVLLCASHEVDAHQEVELIRQISSHLAKGEGIV